MLQGLLFEESLLFFRMVALVYTEEVPGSTPLQHTDTKTEPPTSIHLEANDTNVDLSNIKPAYCYGDTDIPVFTPVRCHSVY